MRRVETLVVILSLFTLVTVRVGLVVFLHTRHKPNPPEQSLLLMPQPLGVKLGRIGQLVVLPAP